MPSRVRVYRWFLRVNRDLAKRLNSDETWAAAGAAGLQSRSSRIKLVLEQWIKRPWAPGSPPAVDRLAALGWGFELDLRWHHEEALRKAAEEWQCAKTEALRRILWGWIAKSSRARPRPSAPAPSGASEPAPV